MTTSNLDQITPTEEDEKREKKHKKMLLKKELEKKLLNKNYSFTDPDYEYFEPSSDKPIDEDKLTFEKLKAYHVDHYHVCDKPYIHLNKIENIIGRDRAKYLIELNTSEYYKVLTHFMILSIIKSSWVNLLADNPTTISKPSLSNDPIAIGDKDSKKVNDAIILCFYSRLLEGMTKQDKERYQILSPVEIFPTGFDKLLFKLDEAIQNLFSYEKKILDGNDESLSPDANLSLAILKTYIPLYNLLERPEKEDYSVDTLRATLIKCASLNRAINHIDAILNIQNEIIRNLPDDLGQLMNITSESEILPAISGIFKEKITNLPNDLIECSKLVCEMYIISSLPPSEIDEFNNRHIMPDNIAVSAALLYHDVLLGKKLSLNIRGETNPYINAYKTLSDFAKKIHSLDILNTETLSDYRIPEELFKYLTTRYSISAFSLSEIDPKKGAEAHLRVRKSKLELQQKIYDFLKDMSVKDAYQFIEVFCHYVDHTINKARVSIDDMLS